MHAPAIRSIGLAVAAAWVLVTSTGAAAAPPHAVDARWVWPLDDVRVVEPYVAPAHRYAAGHRGLDLAAPVGAVVRAPDDGVIAFAGAVAGRDVVTIDHGGGLVSTLEPVTSDLAAGTAVGRASPVGTVSVGGHVSAGAMHLGARLDGEYINPLRLLGGVPRAILLPCCGPIDRALR